MQLLIAILRRECKNSRQRLEMDDLDVLPLVAQVLRYEATMTMMGFVLAAWHARAGQLVAGYLFDTALRQLREKAQVVAF
jgi:hypothetical protein